MSEGDVITKAKPKLTQEALHESLKPPNNCKVKQFRDTLDAQSTAVFDEAIGYNAKDYPASSLVDLLIKSGYDAEQVPGSDAIADHRAGRRPCRCKG